MKKIIYGSLLLGLMAVTSLSSCKKEEDVTPVSNKAVEPFETPTIKEMNGWVIMYSWQYPKGIRIGSYKRNVQNNPVYGFGCYIPAGGCLPDHIVTSNNSGGGSLDELTNEINDFPEAIASNISTNYGIPLVTAVNNGPESIKTFFNEILIEEMDFSEQLITDFNNDLLTIKKFGENYFIVNIDATSPEDAPSFE